MTNITDQKQEVKTPSEDLKKLSEKEKQYLLGLIKGFGLAQETQKICLTSIKTAQKSKALYRLL